MSKETIQSLLLLGIAVAISVIAVAYESGNSFAYINVFGWVVAFMCMLLNGITEIQLSNEKWLRKQREGKA